MLLFWFRCGSRARTGALAAVFPSVEASPVKPLIQRPSVAVPLRASWHGSDQLRVGGGLFAELGCTFVSAGASAAGPVLHSTRTLRAGFWESPDPEAVSTREARRSGQRLHAPLGSGASHSWQRGMGGRDSALCLWHV